MLEPMIPNALTIAGSDSSGGAGLQADLKTFAVHGVYGASVVTALTAQNTKGITAVHAVPVDFIAAQLDAVYSDFTLAAIKIGMVGTEAAIRAVVSWLGGIAAVPVVLDPVMVATSGEALLDVGAESALVRGLMPLARLITPNIAEAACLLGEGLADNVDTMERQAKKLHGLGAQAVLLTGGDLAGPEAVDVLVNADGAVRFAAKRLVTPNTHGTGCTLSSAIAANLALGRPLCDAVERAKAFVGGALAAAGQLSVGEGPGPLNHGFRSIPFK